MSISTTTTTVPANVSWSQEVWNDLESWEQDLVAALHDAGIIFSSDVWPYFKTLLTTFAGQEFQAFIKALIPAASTGTLVGAVATIGAALVTTATTQGEADALNAVTQVQTAVAADPALQALQSAAQAVATANPPAAS